MQILYLVGKNRFKYDVFCDTTMSSFPIKIHLSFGRGVERKLRRFHRRRHHHKQQQPATGPTVQSIKFYWRRLLASAP